MSGAHERDGAGRFAAQRVDQEIDRVALGQWQCGGGQIHAIQPGFAMHMFRRHQLAHQRGIATGINRDIRPPRQFADAARIHMGQRQRHIARDAGDAQQCQFRRGQREQNGHRVILSGVGVDDDLACHGMSLFCAAQDAQPMRAAQGLLIRARCRFCRDYAIAPCQADAVTLSERESS